MFKKFVLTVCTVLTLTLCSIGLFGCNVKSNSEEANVNEILNNFDLVFNNEEVEDKVFEDSLVEPYVLLSSGSTSSSSNYVSKSLKATVYPEDTTNSAVTWSIAWESGSLVNEDISQYLYLVVDDYDSRKCDVRCIKGFAGSVAKITVTTVDGGFRAFCTATYAGIPQSIGCILNGTDIPALATYNVGIGTYTGSLYLKNNLGSSIDGSNAIGSEFGTYELVSVTANVKYNVIVESILNGSILNSEAVVIDTTDSLTSNKFLLERHSDNITTDLKLTIDASTFVDVSLDGNNISINMKKSQGSVLFGNPYVRDGWYVYYNGPYYDPRGGGQPQPCLINIVFKETTSGLIKQISLEMNISAESVSIDPSSVQF